LIIKGNIVALFQGKSEAGPRALGNRSILYDPRDPNAKDHVNKIKKREWFRPFAGSMLLEYAHEWFDMAGLNESPFMSYAVKVWEDKENLIPGIIHVDGTCRIQTVTKEQNYHYYNLIESFYQKTNVPILFNTSFNLGGEVLVETLDDAIDTLKRSEIEYLFLPEEMRLIVEENK
jgi:carbamoyltransferase